MNSHCLALYTVLDTDNVVRLAGRVIELRGICREPQGQMRNINIRLLGQKIPSLSGL